MLISLFYLRKPPNLSGVAGWHEILQQLLVMRRLRLGQPAADNVTVCYSRKY
jgi:hypothetical protein